MSYENGFSSFVDTEMAAREASFNSRENAIRTIKDAFELNGITKSAQHAIIVGILASLIDDEDVKVSSPPWAVVSTKQWLKEMDELSIKHTGQGIL